ncbi:hypothetical protein BDB01DRAFT_737694 [Pilobolus umbonatus]|nr:hypothetical protein BDB01DRAFT_737694 [Pilobolus umbonatus]
MSVISPITQIEEIPVDEGFSQHELPHLLHLSVRGIRMDINRDTLFSLPESILIDMFPMGFTHDNAEIDDISICNVDFNPNCLIYLLKCLSDTKDSHKTRRKDMTDFTEEAYLVNAISLGIPPSPLLTKQGVIVLREILEYYMISDMAVDMRLLKKKATQLLLDDNPIFDSLIKNMNKKNSGTEHHLIELLCEAGFSIEDHWSHRQSEPNKTCIHSLSLIRLEHNDRLKIGQKMLLFWKKPARKCWWDHNMIQLDDQFIKIWCRRVWTLELVLI